MNDSARFRRLSLLALAVVFLAAGCHKNEDQNAASDPASANMAPVSDTSSAAPSSAAPTTYSRQPSAPAPATYNAQQSPSDSGGSYDQDQGNYDPGYGEQPEYTADQAPPPLPDYDQPPDPGDGYLWTPGYWAWAPQGYYWVPGVWTEAPYEGALWTPGYWGFWHNHYHFYHGYWGQYIGFYGGINYGYGYTGAGYQGGYWNGGHFNYNREVNNVNISVVHNVYSHPVAGNRDNTRASFNGGSGGVQVRARPAELVALRAPHVAPMTAQIQNQRAASTNKAQFAAVNHGRPATVAVSRPLAADRNVKPPPPLLVHNQVAPQQRQEITPQHPVEPQQQMHPMTPQQRQAATQSQAHQAAPEQRQMTPQAHPATPPSHQTAQPQRQMTPQARPVAPPQHQAVQQHQAAPQARPAAPPQRQPAPQPKPHPAPPPQRQAAPPQHPPAPQRQDEERKK